MELITLADAPPHDPDHIVVRPFLDGRQCNLRVIRLSPGQALPPHTHGALADYRGDEKLQVRNDDTEGMTLLAFLAPPFPPAHSR